MSPTQPRSGIEVAGEDIPVSERVHPILSSMTRLLAEILHPLGKESESPMLMVIFWCAMAALTYWFVTLE